MASFQTCPTVGASQIDVTYSCSRPDFANQAFFERLTFTDDDPIDAEPGVPFDTC